MICCSHIFMTIERYLNQWFWYKRNFWTGGFRAEMCLSIWLATMNMTEDACSKTVSKLKVAWR